MAGTKARPEGSNRIAVQVLLIFLALGVLAVPFVVVATSGTASLDATWTTLRIAALLAFSLIFMNIVTGAFRPFFNRVFKARTIQRFHIATGLAGFSLALAHGILAFTYGITGYNAGVVYIGPAVLVVLFAAILTALTRRRMRHTWRWIHRLNYVIFAAVFTHALVLGYDLGNEVWLKGLFSLYVAVAAAGLIYRLAPYLRPKDGKSPGKG